MGRDVEAGVDVEARSGEPRDDDFHGVLHQRLEEHRAGAEEEDMAARCEFAYDHGPK